MPPSAGSKASKAAANSSKAAKAPKRAGKSRASARANAVVTAGARSLSKTGGGNGGPPRRKYRPFSDEESKALIVGVKRYGLGNWTRIHDDPDLPFMSTQRTPIDLKDKWRVLSKKLSNEDLQEATPSAAEQPTVKVAALPPQYSREHLVLLPYHELVTLVLDWQAYHYRQKQQNCAFENGQQLSSAIAAPNLQIPSGPAHSVPVKTERSPERAQGQKRRAKQQGDANGTVRIPPSATMAGVSQGISASATSTLASRSKRTKVDVNTEAAAEQMTMLSPNLAPTPAEHSPTPIGGHDSTSGFSPGIRIAGSAPMSPPTLSTMSTPALQDRDSQMHRMSTVSVDRVLGRVTDSSSNFPGRLPPSGSLADPRASAGPKINLTSLANHSDEAAIQTGVGVMGGPNSGQNVASSGALEPQQQYQQQEQDQDGSQGFQQQQHQSSNETMQTMALSLSRSTERLTARLNDSAVNVFPIGRSRSQEGFDTLRMVASRSADELNNLSVRTSQCQLPSCGCCYPGYHCDLAF